MKVWMLCEAFTLTGDDFNHQTVHKSLAPWGLPCKSRKVAMLELKESVKERVGENYEGMCDADEDIESDIRGVLENPTRLGRGRWRFNYSADDREVVWLVYPCDVMESTKEKRR